MRETGRRKLKKEKSNFLLQGLVEEEEQDHEDTGGVEVSVPCYFEAEVPSEEEGIQSEPQP